MSIAAKCDCGQPFTYCVGNRFCPKIKEEQIPITQRTYSEQEVEKFVKWGFRNGWKERSRMVGVNKAALSRQYHERIRIIIDNKLHLKERFGIEIK